MSSRAQRVERLPASPPTPPTPARPAEVRSIADLITSTAVIGAASPVQELVRMFEADPNLDAVAVQGTGRVGLVCRSRLFPQLGSRFGYSLLANRSVALVMEDGSTVEAHALPQEVVTLALQREDARIYDDIVVVEGGRYRGLVSMRSLMAHHKDLLVASCAEVALLDEKNQRLEEVQRLQADFLANMTHELRTPLHVILGLSELMLMEGGLSAQHVKNLQLIRARGTDQLVIVNNMLDLCRLDAGVMTPVIEPVELVPLFEELLASAEVLVGAKPVRVTIDLRNLPATFPSDPVFLRRILDNLLSNAVKFTPAGTVTLAAEGDAHGLTLAVRDTGSGIRPTDQSRLFSRFGQMDPSRSKRHAGTGLGLSIVKGLVQQLGGAVSVDSQVGEGSCFTVRLPAVPQRPR